MIKDILASGRVSNLPSVITNVLVGAAIALSLSFGEGVTLGLNFIYAAVAGCFLYVGGCFYNDFHDRHWDAEHKPHRGIPAGRINATVLGQLVILFALAGVTFSGLLGVPGIAVAASIALFICIYTWIHKKTPLGIIPMGMCRAGLYFLGFVSVHDLSGDDILRTLMHVVPAAAGLMCYIAGITLVARTEASGKPSPEVTWLGLALLATPVFTHFIQGQVDTSALLYLIGIILLVIFLKHKVEKSVGGFVSLCLAGICVIDGLFLINLIPRAFGDSSFYVAIGTIVIGFGLSIALQKIAPAT